MAVLAIVAMQWLGSSTDVHAAERNQSVSEKRAEGHSATERQSQVIQVNADLTHDIDRLEKRGTQSDVYDLFSRPASPSSAARSRGKEAAPVQPAKTKPDETEVIVVKPVVIAPPVQAIVAPIVAPVVLPPPPPPPAPKPPAVPFAYMGKFEEGDRSVYFFVKGDKLYMVKPGEDIDEAYSFDGEADHQLRLTYKPLRVAQTLTVGP